MSCCSPGARVDTAGPYAAFLLTRPLRPRDILLLLGLTGLGIALAALAFGLGAEAAGPGTGLGPLRDPGPAIVVTMDPTDPDEDSPAAETAPMATTELDDASGHRDLDPDAPPPTDGVIEGSVSMPVDLLGHVTSYRIRTVELMGASSDRLSTGQPFDKTWPAFKVPYDHTPRFRIEGVPLSRYGYRVELLAKHCNGGSAIARLSASSPFAEVRLSITKPVTFTMRLQDQHMNAHAGWHIHIRPTGNPIGRDVHTSDTDRFGTAIFREVVAGDYEVWRDGNQLGTVTVSPITFPRRGQPIRVQSASLIVPAGRELRVEIFAPGGLGLRDVALELHKTDTTSNRRFEGHTDHGGIHTFQYLEPGRYQLDISLAGFQRTTRTIRIHPEDAAEPMKVRLAAIR